MVGNIERQVQIHSSPWINSSLWATCPVLWYVDTKLLSMRQRIAISRNRHTIISAPESTVHCVSTWSVLWFVDGNLLATRQRRRYREMAQDYISPWINSSPCAIVVSAMVFEWVGECCCCVFLVCRNMVGERSIEADEEWKKRKWRKRGGRGS